MVNTTTSQTNNFLSINCHEQPKRTIREILPDRHYPGSRTHPFSETYSFHGRSARCMYHLYHAPQTDVLSHTQKTFRERYLCRIALAGNNSLLSGSTLTGGMAAHPQAADCQCRHPGFYSYHYPTDRLGTDSDQL